MNFEVGDEPPSVAAYRADGTKPPAADLTGIYARFPTGPSSDELAAATTAWLKANKPEVLDSKVEKAFREREWLIMWTPPYCPKFQPHRALVGRGQGARVRHMVTQPRPRNHPPPPAHGLLRGQGQPGVDLGTC